MAKFCTNCGMKREEKDTKCPNCGKVFKYENKPINESDNVKSSRGGSNVGSENKTSPTAPAKNRIVAGIIALFFGSFGIHNFYLGYIGKGIGQLFLTLFGWIVCFIGPVISGLWAFIEAILLFTGYISKDGYGNDLTD